MDKKLAGLLGAVAGLATIGNAQAAINAEPDAAQALSANSYADLLAPVPNAVALLEADNATRARRQLELAQYYNYPPPPYYYHHHHHHHNSYYNPYAYPYNNYHHHHHHHHNSAFIGIPGVGGVVVGR